MLTKREPEKCYYCNKPAEYNDLVGSEGNYSVAGVCSDHVQNYGSPA